MVSALMDHPEVRSGVELLSAWIEGQMAYKGLPGLSFAIVHDQELVWARGFGWADVQGRVRATAETLYRVASITKLFTATALLQLRDAGKLRLDDRVADILPWFEPRPGPDETSPITIRHLITHTSGLPREAPFPYWSEAVFPPIADVCAAVPRRLASSPQKAGGSTRTWPSWSRARSSRRYRQCHGRSTCGAASWNRSG
jgi:D-alanyl-D-alanine carboxypeptidase